MNRNNRNSLRLVPVIVNGTTVMIDPSSINKTNRIVHHGSFQRTPVNSPASFHLGNSVIVWPDADKPHAFSISKASLGVLAQQFLESQRVGTAS